MESGTLATTPVQTELKDRIQDLYDRGLYLQAHELSQECGPIRDWTGPEWRLLGGRLAGNIGAPRLGMYHLIKAWRERPGHPEAAWYYARHLTGLLGPLVGWRWMRERGDYADQPAHVRGPWLSLHGEVLARLRDFDAAERWFAQAEAISPELPWIHVEKAFLLLQEDRPEDALAAARRSLELRPWYRAGVQEVGHLLVQLGRDAEALDFLREASANLESSAVHFQLAALQLELKHHHDARQTLDEAIRLSPLLEKEWGQLIHARRSDAAYYCDDVPVAIDLARLSDSPFHKELADRLEAPPEGGKRVLLDVPFVRQDYKTCVPATLVSISRYWNMPADHLEVAADICYDGTPHASERRWAEENGWLAREFTVTWDAARALLDRGCPFTLATADPGNAHLQGVVGYDDFRGTLLIREPSDRHLVEFAVEKFLKHYAPTGPRGMVLIPIGDQQGPLGPLGPLENQGPNGPNGPNGQAPAANASGSLLEGIDLPDAALYDELYALQRALLDHDRDRAAACLSRLQGQADRHYVTWQGLRAMAQYDGDAVGLLACAEGMLELFPESMLWELMRVNCLRQLDRQQQRLELLEKLVDREPSDPMCWQQYAQELSQDARRHDDALFWLRRAHRFNPFNAGVVCGFARIRWAQGRFAEALELDRFAFCLSDKDETLARNYFISARSQGRLDEALEFLRRRFARFGMQSSHPAHTLFWALAQLERHEESFRVLEEAREMRPEDGELLLFAAEMHCQYGKFAQARELLEAARGKAAKTAWMRTAANLAASEGEPREALRLWREVLAIEPLAMDAHASVARLLAETESREQAREYLRAASVRFPSHYALGQLTLEWLRDEGDEKLEPHVRHFLELHPSDAWAHRELALTLLGLARNDEALAEIELAEALEPFSALSKAFRGRILLSAGRVHEARSALKQAIRLSVDLDLAVRDLVSSCETQFERREALKFIEEELLRQTILGDGLLTFREVARHNMPDEELLALLRRGLEARSDLWHAWAAVIRQLVAMNELDQALDLANQAVARFPLLPALWIDLAQTHRARGDGPLEIEVLNKALEINPANPQALYQLSEACEAMGEPEKAREALQSAINHAPLLPINHYNLAEWLWWHDRRPEALERILQVLRLEPGFDVAWTRLSEWSQKLDGGETSRRFARELTQSRPAEVRSWLMLVRTLTRREETDEVLAALDRALELRPNSVEACDLKAEVLTQAGRMEEALAACRVPAVGDPPPLLLQARAAWVEYHRGNTAEAFRLMEDVVAEDPNYFWAWQQLGDWYQAKGAWDDYRRASENLVRLAPESFLALAYHGEALTRTGDAEAGKAQLARAFDLNPSFPMSGLLLVDQYFTGGELEQAEATLATLQREVGGPFVEARQVRLLALQGNREEACKTALALCGIDGADPWPVQTALGALENAGWYDEARELLYTAGEQEVFNPEAAISLVERYPPRDPGEHERQMQIIDGAITRHPEMWKLHDVKADLLVRENRFEEALAACQPASLDPQPVYLRGRQAWIEHARGRKLEGIELIRQCVQDEPRYFWAWSCLRQWYEEVGDDEGCLNSARSLVELAPQDPVNHAYLALAHRTLHENAPARESLYNALKIAPDYAFASQRLFQWGIEDRADADVDWVLALLRDQPNKAHYHACEITWAVHRKDTERALGHLRDLCDCSKDNLDLLEKSLKEMTEAGMESEADGVLVERMSAGNHIGECWAKRLTLKRNAPPDVPTDVLAQFAEAPARTNALVGTCVAAGQYRRGDTITSILDTHGPELRASTEDWGVVGYGLALASLWPRLTEWMDDWREHTDAKPWMLSNLVTGYLNTDQDEKACELARHCLEMPPDHTQPTFDLCLAAADLFTDNVQRGCDHFYRVNPANLSSYQRLQHALLSAVVEMEINPPERRAEIFAKVRRDLAAAAKEFEPYAPDFSILKTYRRVVKRLAELRGTWTARLWSWYRQAVPLVKEKVVA